MLRIDKFAESEPNGRYSVEKQKLSQAILLDFKNAGGKILNRMSQMNLDAINSIIGLALIQVFKQVELFDNQQEGSLL